MYVVMQPRFFALMVGESQHLFVTPAGWQFRDYSPSMPGQVTFFNITDEELGRIMDECKFIRMDGCS